MNSLITSGFTGGFPFVLDDIRFLDSIYKEAITVNMASIGGDNFIISGCTYSTGGGKNPICLQSGYVMLGGEILKVNGGTYDYNKIYLTKSSTYDSAGIKVSKDETYTGSTYQINKAIPTSTATSFDYTSASNLSDIIKNKAPKPTSWTPITTFSNGAHTVNGVNILKYRDDGYGNIEIRGILIVTDTSLAFKISALANKFDDFAFTVPYSLPGQGGDVTYVRLNSEGGFICPDTDTFNKHIFFNLKILI